MATLHVKRSKRKSKKKKPEQLTMRGIIEIEVSVSRETRKKKPKFFLVPHELLGPLVVSVSHFLADSTIIEAEKKKMRLVERRLLEVVESKPVSRETRKKGSRVTPKKQRSPRSA